MFMIRALKIKSTYVYLSEGTKRNDSRIENKD